MAVTGLILVGFLVGHLLGNFEFFLGSEAINSYAEFLKKNPMLVWPARVVLLVAFCLHIIMAVSLWEENRQARPQGYQYQKTIRASTASLTMVFTGGVIFLFVIAHLMHFTFFSFNPEFFTYQEKLSGHHERHDVFRMVVSAFRNPWVSLGYIVAQGFLYLHLSHGISSMLKTLGGNRPNTAFWVKRMGPLVAGLFFVGYVSIPVAVWLGFVGSSTP